MPMRGKRRRSGTTRRDPPSKRIASERKSKREETNSDSEEVEIVEDQQESAYSRLLSSLAPAPSASGRPSRSAPKKKVEKPKEIQEIEQSMNDRVPAFTLEAPEGHSSDSDHSPSPSPRKTGSDDGSEEEEDNEAAEDEEESIEEEEAEQEQIGRDHVPVHFDFTLSAEQIEMLAKATAPSFDKDLPLVQQINEFLTRRHPRTVSTAPSPPVAYFAPSVTGESTEEEEKANPISCLPTEHAEGQKKLKKGMYAESVASLYMKRKLRTAFQEAAGREMKEISKKRKQILSVQEEFLPLPTTEEQHGLFCCLLPLLDQYYDVFFSLQTPFNAEILRLAYMLHVVNHTQKMRDTVLRNSAQVKLLEKQETELKKKLKYVEKEYWMAQPEAKRGKKVPAELESQLNPIEEQLQQVHDAQALAADTMHDQGFTRPRTLILVPTQEVAGKLVETFMALFPVSQVHHRKRFVEYFLPADRNMEPHPQKPADYNALFHGSTDDTFYICLKMAQRALKLYADPYDSDVIIASPLGLRSMIDKKSERRGCHDFLSSIEICVLDLCDVFLMQNWTHVEYIFKHLNNIPELPRDTDFSRVRPYFLEGWSKYYRQTIVLSQMITPEIQALFNRHCFNYQGKIRIQQALEGVIDHIPSRVPQRFEKISCSSLVDAHESRFQYFIQETISQVRGSTQQNHTLIYIPSYFDFVRVRNHFKQERYSFMSINEYSSGSEIGRGRLNFFEGNIDFLLVTGRFHFFRRYKIRGIKQLIFYSPPLYPEFYKEFVSVVDETEGSSLLLYVQPFDQMALQRIVGNRRCRKMLKSPKNSIMLVSRS